MIITFPNFQNIDSPIVITQCGVCVLHSGSCVHARVRELRWVL